MDAINVGILSVIPPVIAISLALITKEYQERLPFAKVYSIEENMSQMFGFCRHFQRYYRFDDFQDRR